MWTGFLLLLGWTGAGFAHAVGSQTALPLRRCAITRRAQPLAAASKGFGRARTSGDRRPTADTPCGCGSGQPYGSCCSRLHDGELATSVHELIRARFTAYQYRLPDFLLSPAHAKAAADTKGLRKELLSYMGSYNFKSLQLGEVVDEAPADGGSERARCKMSVEYMARAPATLKSRSKILSERVVTLHESSAFERAADGGWRYVEADSQQEYEGEEGYTREADKPTS